MSDTCAQKQRPVIQYLGIEQRKVVDNLCVEEPLMLHLAEGHETAPESQPLLTIMRTPGEDIALVTGFLNSEGLLQSADDIVDVMRLPKAEQEDDPNQLLILLKQVPEDLPQRRFSMTSSCGLCGRLMIDDLVRMQPDFPDAPDVLLSQSVLAVLNERVKSQQQLYLSTGASHAASLFDVHGQLISLKEDIGRHNAVDKLIGQAMLDKQLPLSKQVLLISGRVSYELMQKAIMAGIQIVIAVGAPSSMALHIAQRFDITLIGFLKSNSYTIYHGQWRIDQEEP